jgi:hypothetical protein
MKTQSFVLAFVAAAAMCAAPLPAPAQVSVGISLTFGSPPPPIPVYVQPYPPGPDYIWSPGYWDGSPDGYYWVPGTWVLAPEPGLLWTPGYWAWDGDAYAWTPGYWANDVGFYGGVNYGYGYFGVGYDGGVWSGDVFEYNTYVTRVDAGFRHHHHVYFDPRVYVNRSHYRISYDGGRDGLRAHADARELRASHGRHFGMTSAQRGHVLAASHDRSLLARYNHGRPNRLAVSHPLGTGRRASGFAARSPHETIVARHGGAVTHHAMAGYTTHRYAASPHYASQPHHYAAAQHYASHQIYASGAGMHSHGGGGTTTRGGGGMTAHVGGHHQHG